MQWRGQVFFLGKVFFYLFVIDIYESKYEQNSAI